MPSYAGICYKAEKASYLKSFEFYSKLGISWYKFAKFGVLNDD